MADIKPSKHIIAYVDFLGTKEKIKNDKNNEYLRFLKQLYTELFTYIDKTNKSNDFLKTIKVRSFSDNVLFAISLSSTNMQAIYALGEFIRICSIIQVTALKNEILTRGGITIGDIYIDKNMAYGTGLLDVLSFEEEIAHFPRIIIDDNICNNYPTYFQSNYNTIYDKDNITYIDFYETCKLNRENINICKNSLVNLQNKHKTNLKVMSKINWIVQHHNSYIDKYIKLQNDSTLESLLIKTNNLNDDKNLYSLRSQSIRSTL